jgi:hypothetical protein
LREVAFGSLPFFFPANYQHFITGAEREEKPHPLSVREKQQTIPECPMFLRMAAIKHFHTLRNLVTIT